MTAHVIEIRTTIPKPYVSAGQPAHGYTATCDDHETRWYGPAHLIGWESAPNAAAIIDAELHNEDHHPGSAA